MSAFQGRSYSGVNIWCRRPSCVIKNRICWEGERTGTCSRSHLYCTYMHKTDLAFKLWWACVCIWTSCYMCAGQKIPAIIYNYKSSPSGPKPAAAICKRPSRCCCRMNEAFVWLIPLKCPRPNNTLAVRASARSSISCYSNRAFPCCFHVTGALIYHTRWLGEHRSVFFFFFPSTGL